MCTLTTIHAQSCYLQCAVSREGLANSPGVPRVPQEDLTTFPLAALGMANKFQLLRKIKTCTTLHRLQIPLVLF